MSAGEVHEKLGKHRMDTSKELFEWRVVAASVSWHKP